MPNDPTDIRNWLRLSRNVTTSGRLQHGDPKRLANIGVKRVINLALSEHPEALPDAERAMADAGIDYHHIPVPFDAPDDAHYHEFVEALEAESSPVHVHCIMNWRVSAFFYRYNLSQGMEPNAAKELLNRIWDPDTLDDPNADIWAAFVRGEEE